MRHIPEAELHAYLDQGLSRSQCVEIESHLADCPSCQATRDGIAALRDQTTALLSRLAPPRGFPPAFDVLRDRAAAAANQRRRRMHAIAWAASLVAAVGLGWSASSLARVHEVPRATTRSVATAPTPAAPATTVAPTSPAASEPAPARPVATTPKTPRESAAPSRAARSAAVRLAAAKDSSEAARKRQAALSVLNPTPALELTPLERPGGRSEIELGGMWRTMSWDGAKAEAGERVPHIDGLPVVQVQIQSGEQGARPVMVVAQQLSSGQVIRTIEGPATDVSQLLSRRAMADVDSVLLPGDSGGSARDADHAMAMQVGDRMLAITGDLPSDSLRAMIRRLNAEMRSK